MTTETRRVSHVHIDKQGRIVIPAEFREALGIKEGDRLAVIMEDGELRVRTMREVVRRIQEEVAKYLPEGESLVDKLLEDRRREVEQEERELEESRRMRSSRRTDPAE